MNEEHMNYAAFKQDCDCMVAVVGEERPDAGKHVGKWIKAGYRVERVTNAVVREKFGKCAQCKQPQTKKMFED